MPPRAFDRKSPHRLPRASNSSRKPRVRCSYLPNPPLPLPVRPAQRREVENDPMPRSSETTTLLFRYCRRLESCALPQPQQTLSDPLPAASFHQSQSTKQEKQVSETTYHSGIFEAVGWGRTWWFRQSWVTNFRRLGLGIDGYIVYADLLWNSTIAPLLFEIVFVH